MIVYQEEELPYEEGDEVALILVPDNSRYAPLSLTGTKWQLVGFVDEKKKQDKTGKAWRLGKLHANF